MLDQEFDAMDRDVEAELARYDALTAWLATQ